MLYRETIMKFAQNLSLFFTVLAAVGCAGGGGSSGSGADPVTAQKTCENQFQSPAKGTEITAKQFVSGENLNWKLIHAEFYQFIGSKRESQKNLYLGYSLKVDEPAATFNKMCGGGSSDLTGNFNYSGPSLIRAKDGVIVTKIEGHISGHPSEDLEHEVRFLSGRGEKISFGDLPQGASGKITQTSSTTVEVWINLPTDSGDSKGHFIFRYTYKAVSLNPDGSPGTPIQPSPVTPIRPSPITGSHSSTECSIRVTNGYYSVSQGSSQITSGNSDLNVSLQRLKDLIRAGVCTPSKAVCETKVESGYYSVVQNNESVTAGYSDFSLNIARLISLKSAGACSTENTQSECTVRVENGYYSVNQNGSQITSGYSDFSVNLDRYKELVKSGACAKSRSICSTSVENGYYSVVQSGQAVTAGYSDFNVNLNRLIELQTAGACY
jgi:hypothetical protein